MPKSRQRDHVWKQEKRINAMVAQVRASIRRLNTRTPIEEQRPQGRVAPRKGIFSKFRNRPF